MYYNKTYDTGRRKRKKSLPAIIVIGFIVVAFIFAYQAINYYALSIGGEAYQKPQNNYTQPAKPIPTEKPINADLYNILLVNTDNPLPTGYQPKDLINLYEQKNRHFELARSNIDICKQVFEAMNFMFSAANMDGIDGFIITSGYRSHADQKTVFATSTDGYAARPGESEHEAGLAFDVAAKGNQNFELTPQFEWLLENCGKYGFILRYPKGAESITGFPFESWHFRYVGVEHSKSIMNQRITLEEYLENL